MGATEGGSYRLRWTGEREIACHPFPYARPLSLSLPCRMLPDRPYATEDELRMAWRAAPAQGYDVLLRPDA